MNKILFTAKVDSHILAFHLPYLKYFKSKGFEVHVASGGDEVIPYCDVKYNISFGSNPFSRELKKSIKHLNKILEQNNFSIVHTHTAIASVLTRISCAKITAYTPRVMYTAHGFHFLKGGKIKDWILYYPIEKALSKYTDDLILINHEDYELAVKKNMAKRVHYIDGIGVDINKFWDSTNETSDSLCTQLEGKFVITFVAELNNNKNQIDLLNAIKILHKSHPNIVLLLVGIGENQKFYREFVDIYGLNENVKLLGYRNDVPQILKCTDLYVSTSRREGLGLNIIEAIASGLYVIAYRGRGHNEIIIDGVNGQLIDHTLDSLTEAILTNIETPHPRTEEQFKSVEKFDCSNAIKKMKEIYEDFE